MQEVWIVTSHRFRLLSLNRQGKPARPQAARGYLRRRNDLRPLSLPRIQGTDFVLPLGDDSSDTGVAVGGFSRDLGGERGTSDTGGLRQIGLSCGLTRTCGRNRGGPATTGPLQTAKKFGTKNVSARRGGAAAPPGAAPGTP